MIVALLVGGAGANVGLMLVATSDASFAVEPDYYQKALAWDETMAQAARNRRSRMVGHGGLRSRGAGRVRSR